MKRRNANSQRESEHVWMNEWTKPVHLVCLACGSDWLGFLISMLKALVYLQGWQLIANKPQPFLHPYQSTLQCSQRQRVAHDPTLAKYTNAVPLKVSRHAWKPHLQSCTWPADTVPRFIFSPPCFVINNCQASRRRINGNKSFEACVKCSHLSLPDLLETSSSALLQINSWEQHDAC